MNPLWHLFSLCALAHLTNAGTCTRDQSLQFKRQFLPNLHGLTMSGLSNVCVKIIQPTDSVPTNLELVIWGTKFGTSDPVSVVAQVELECDTHNVIIPKKVNEACAIIGGDVAACQNSQVNLEAELMKALKAPRAADNCPAHASTDIGKKAAEIERKGRPTNPEPGRQHEVVNWDLDRRYNIENPQKMLETRMAVKAADGVVGGTHGGKLLMVVETVTEDGYRYALALASKGAKWTVGQNDVMYFLDGKKIDSANVQKTFKDGVNADKITAFLV